MKGADVFLSGIGTHYVKRESIPALIEGLKTITTPSAVDGVVGRFVVEGPPPAFTLPASALDVIKRAFSVPATIEGVLNALSNEALRERGKLA